MRYIRDTSCRGTEEIPSKAERKTSRSNIGNHLCSVSVTWFSIRNSRLLHATYPNPPIGNRESRTLWDFTPSKTRGENGDKRRGAGGEGEGKPGAAGLYRRDRAREDTVAQGTVGARGRTVVVARR